MRHSTSPANPAPKSHQPELPTYPATMNLILASYTSTYATNTYAYFPTLDEAKLAVNEAALEAGRTDPADWAAILDSATYTTVKVGRTKADICDALNDETGQDWVQPSCFA